LIGRGEVRFAGTCDGDARTYSSNNAQMSPGGGAACQRSTDHPKWWKGLGLRAYSVFAAAVEQPCREGPWWRGLGSLVAATCEGVGGGDL